MTAMTGGEALVEMLRRHGVDTVFALPGVQNDALFAALYDARNAIRVVHTRHEQAAAYMAYGYARATGRVGTYIVVPGPGFLNTSAALSTAYATSTPVLCIAGQIPLAMIGRGVGLLHEIPDQLGIMQRLTKWAARIERPADAPHLVSEAFYQLTSGRPRPVALEVPLDVLAEKAEVAITDPLPPEAPPGADPAAIGKAAELLAGAARPMIIAGGGTFGAGPEILRLAERLQAPVVSTYTGKGAVDWKHSLTINLPTGHRLWPDVDVVLAIGTRMQAQLVNWGVDDALKVVRVDIDPLEISRVRRPTIGIVGDARVAVTALSAALASMPPRPSRQAEISAVKATVAEQLRQLSPQVEFAAAIREAIPEDGIYVDELTQVAYVGRVTMPFSRPRSYIDSGYQGTLGFGFPTALGVKVAFPERPVVSVSGDGGFMYAMPELATAVLHGIAVVAVVFTDNAFGNVKRIQRTDYGGKVLASDLHNPDFAKLAVLFGASGARATTPAELTAEIRAAIKRPGPTLIEVPVGEMPDPWKLIHMGRARPKAQGGA
ncbi:MAG TPA: thiamine pyrophosphate-dependent enzyme [Stellaceae bacterium]|jgi:acetolactate synthase-1/2/3 large subunit|nr:thiamine pyrophosphate-dependent enzyme [Stellaceae bacterium]